MDDISYKYYNVEFLNTGNAMWLWLSFTYRCSAAVSAVSGG